MSSKTNFYFSIVTNTPAQLSIRNIKFPEQIFDIEESSEVVLPSFTSWTMPSRFLIKNLSETPVSIEKIDFNIPDVDDTKRLIKVFSIKRGKELIVDYHEILKVKGRTVMPFSPVSLDSGIEYQIKFSGYQIVGREC